MQVQEMSSSPPHPSFAMEPLVLLRRHILGTSFRNLPNEVGFFYGVEVNCSSKILGLPSIGGLDRYLCRLTAKESCPPKKDSGGRNIKIRCAWRPTFVSSEWKRMEHAEYPFFRFIKTQCEVQNFANTANTGCPASTCFI